MRLEIGAAMPNDENDAKLVGSARLGDRAAFAVLLDRHYPLLLTLCRRMLDAAAPAEDAAQEAALQALVSLDRLRQPERFGPWLAGIGLNVCRRWLRRRVREAPAGALPDAERVVADTIAPEPGPDELAEEAEMRERVRAAVAALPPGQRTAVLLVYLGGLSHREAAATLGVDAGAVKGRLFKARRALRRDLSSGAGGPTMAMTASMAGGVESRGADMRRRAAAGSQLRFGQVVVLDEGQGLDRRLIWAIGATEAEASPWAA
jgi:RNA polymerase sigma factor (sigma-70 family)